MRFRTFGRTGWQVSEIGFGAWQIGGGWGKVDDTQSIDTLLYAFDKGVNFVDTAQMYGGGHSEEVIGRALRQWKGGRIYVATKAQPTVWPDPDGDNPTMRGRYPALHLRGNVENSLKRLGVEQLDLFQLHCWLKDGLSSLDWLETLNDLRREGKVDHIGVSIRDYRPDEGVELARFGLADSIQVVFNMFEQRPAGELFKAGEATGTAFIARVPLDSGSLVGNWTSDSYAKFEPGSQRHSMFRGERFAETLARLEKLKAVCGPHYPTLAEAAMRYVLSAQQVCAVMYGRPLAGKVFFGAFGEWIGAVMYTASVLQRLGCGPRC